MAVAGGPPACLFSSIESELSKASILNTCPLSNPKPWLARQNMSLQLERLTDSVCQGQQVDTAPPHPACLLIAGRLADMSEAQGQLQKVEIN